MPEDEGLERLAVPLRGHPARRIHDVLHVMLGGAKFHGYARENVA